MLSPTGVQDFLDERGISDQDIAVYTNTQNQLNIIRWYQEIQKSHEGISDKYHILNDVDLGQGGYSIDYSRAKKAVEYIVITGIEALVIHRISVKLRGAGTALPSETPGFPSYKKVTNRGVVSGLREKGAFQGMRLTGKTPKGLDRAIPEWRAKYGYSVNRRHHLGPQALLRDKRFTSRVSDLGYTQKEIRSFVHRQMSDIPNVKHYELHAEGWNATWKEWLKRNPQFEISDIQAQIQSMIKEFEIPAGTRGGPKYGR